MPTARSVSSLNSIFGPGSAIRGDVETEGLVRIDGFFSGSLRTTGTVVISRNARCSGPIRASVVVVGGIVKGNIYSSERIDLLPGAVIVGDVFAPRLCTQENTVIHGDCRITGPLADPEKELTAFMESHGKAIHGLAESLARSIPVWRK